MIDEWDEVREKYADPKHDTWTTLVVPILKLIPRERLAQIAKSISARSIQALRNGPWKPSKKHRTSLIRAASDYARAQTGQDIRDALCACAAFLNRQMRSAGERKCDGE